MISLSTLQRSNPAVACFRSVNSECSVIFLEASIRGYWSFFLLDCRNIARRFCNVNCSLPDYSVLNSPVKGSTNLHLLGKRYKLFYTNPKEISEYGHNR